MLILTALIWFAIVFSTLALFGWQTSFHLSNQRRISIADSTNILGALSYDWQNKLLYLVLLLGPFAFLSLLEPILLFPGGIWIIYAILSNYGPYYTISFHYPSFALPFIVVASIFGFKKIASPLKKRRAKIASIILCSLFFLMAILSSPIGSFNIGNYPWTGPFGIPDITPHDDYVQKIAELIPGNASVLTGNDLFPLVAQRASAYVFPFSATFPSNLTSQNSTKDSYSTFNGTMETYLRKVEYVLYDSSTDIAASVILPTLNGVRDFGLYAEADGAILLKKAYSGTPVFSVPYERTFRSGNLISINSTIVQDPFSESGNVLYHYSPVSSSDFWHGPGLFLGCNGTYSVDFRLKLVENASTPPISLAVDEWPTISNITLKGSASLWYIPNVNFFAGNQIYLSAATLQVSNFTQTGSYQTFSLQFKVEKPGGLEFVGLNVPKATRIYLDYIKLSQVTT